MTATEIMMYPREELNNLFLQTVLYSINSNNKTTIKWVKTFREKLNLRKEDTLEDLVSKYPKCQIAKSLSYLSYRTELLDGRNILTFKTLPELKLKLSVLGY